MEIARSPMEIARSPYTGYLKPTEDAFEASSLGVTTRVDTGPSFPMRLHYMMTELEKEGDHTFISWQLHGRSFRVHNTGKDAERLLSLWFRQSKYTSFQRQLSFYGFKRLSKGPDQGCYYHELFLRGNSVLTRDIRRVTVKGTGPRKHSFLDTEPDLSQYPPIPLYKRTQSDGPLNQIFESSTSKKHPITDPSSSSVVPITVQNGNANLGQPRRQSSALAAVHHSTVSQWERRAMCNEHESTYMLADPSLIDRLFLEQDMQDCSGDTVFASGNHHLMRLFELQCPRPYSAEHASLRYRRGSSPLQPLNSPHGNNLPSSAPIVSSLGRRPRGVQSRLLSAASIDCFNDRRLVFQQQQQVWLVQAAVQLQLIPSVPQVELSDLIRTVRLTQTSSGRSADSV